MMKHPLHRILMSLLILAACGTAGWTQEDDPSSPPKVEHPIVILHATGVDRLVQRAETLFAAAGRDEMNPKLQDWLKTSLRELKGMDRTRPFGMMMYLKPGLAGLSAIVYAPVANVEDALNTMSLGTGDYKKVEGKTNRWHVTGQFNQTYAVLVRDGYLFVVSDGDEEELNRNFPAPEKMASRLNNRYDLAASLLIKSVPPATRQIFVTFLQTQTMAELQRRDDEPEASYRVRKANGENTLDLIEKIVTQGEELTIGGRLDERTGLGEIDVEVAGTVDSKLAKFFQGMTGRRSLFANLLQKPSMMTLAMSWQLDEKQRKTFTELFTFAPEEIDRQAAKGGVEGTKSALDPLFETLLRSAETGHLDGFLQINGEGAGGYTFLGGMRVASGTNFPKQLHEALQFSKDKFSQQDRIAALELDVERIDGFPVHRVPMTPPDKPGQWMFGEGAQLYAYASTQALWISFGGEEALAALKAGVQDSKKPASQAEERKQRIPFTFQTRGKQWVTIRQESGADQPPPNRPIRPYESRFREEVSAAFDDQNDGMKLEVRPTDSGARVRFEFQKGWIGLLGRVIAMQVDRATGATRNTPIPVDEEKADSN